MYYTYMNHLSTLLNPPKQEANHRSKQNVSSDKSSLHTSVETISIQQSIYKALMPLFLSHLSNQYSQTSSAQVYY